MKQAYAWLLALATTLPALPAAAQVSLSSFATHTINFNGASGTISFTDNSTVPGVYVGYVSSGYHTAQPISFAANDGSVGSANGGAFHYGTTGSPDRNLGGLANASVTGYAYIGVHVVNNTGATMRNLELSYALEQWFNGGVTNRAEIVVDYQKAAPVKLQVPTPNGTRTQWAPESGTWTRIAELTTRTPANQTTTTAKDGNLAENRQVASYTLRDVNIAPGGNLTLRLRYDINNLTNGNGIGIDDIQLTPQANVFYYKGGSNKLNNLNAWAANANGTGNGPSSFAAANQVFYITSNVGSSNMTGSSSWGISGANSKLVVGDGTSAVTFAVEDGNGDKNRVTGVIDVLDHATLSILRPAGTLPTLGQLSAHSTVAYAQTANNVDVTCASGVFGNLTLSGSGTKVLAQATQLNGNLTLDSGAKLLLGNHRLTVQRDQTISAADATAYVVTDGSGSLRQTVPNNNVPVFYPVGSSTTSYNPAWLTQAQARTEDAFDVAVKNNVYLTYAGAEGSGDAVDYQVVNRTWHLAEADASSPANVTLKVQWTGTQTTADFRPPYAHINHFTGSGWDRNAESSGYAELANGTYQVARGGITSFSPFGVSSRAGGVLPVELLGFGAHRTAGTVVCTWATAQELNAARFEVERSSDALHFVPVGTVAAVGTSTQRHDYRFTDTRPARELTYYRLHQVDTDGREAWSNVVAVAATAAAAAPLTVTPNPGTGLFELWTEAAAGTPLLLTVHSALGTEVLRQRLEAAPKHPQLDLRQLPAGVYFVRVSTADGQRTVRVVKQ